MSENTTDAQPVAHTDFPVGRIREMLADIPDTWRIMLDVPDTLLIFDERLTPKFMLHLGNGLRIPVDGPPSE